VPKSWLEKETAPPARGWARQHRSGARRDPDRPARAGMSPARCGTSCRASRPPRPRGDEPGHRSFRPGWSTTAPPARGWARPT